MPTPIWQNTTYAAAGDDPLTYSITMDGEDIFYGRAFARPGRNSITVNLNRVCQNYLSSKLPPFRTSSYGHSENPGAMRTFSLYNEDTGARLGQYDFVLDWSYDAGVDWSADHIMSRPINGRWVSGMHCYLTEYSGGTVWDTASKDVIAGYYSQADTCGAEYALYYLNRYGGWDSFLIEGRVTRRDAYERYMLTDSTATGRTHQTRPYNNQITPSWELHTGWLTDAQARNLTFNLLSSNMVYLHSLTGDEVIPVYVSDSEAEYKTFRNQGNHLVSFTINVTQSRTETNI